MYLFAFMTLSVKEDAAIFILCIGLYYLLGRHNKHGLFVFLSALVYFIITTSLMSRFGYGIMDSRFNVYKLPGESGLTPIAANIFANPSFFIKTLFTEPKFRFLTFMMGPLLFIPLATRNFWNYILLVPMIVVNLMTAYPYQFDIGFQYTFGTAPLLFFLFVYNTKDFSLKWQRIICIMTVFSSIALMQTATGNWLTGYPQSYQNNKLICQKSDNALLNIPIDASVTAETYLIPHLYRVKDLHMYPSRTDTDYMIFDARYKHENVDTKKKVLEEGGYSLSSSEGYVQIYKRDINLPAHHD